MFYLRGHRLSTQGGRYKRCKVQAKAASRAAEFASKLTQTDWRSLMRKVLTRCTPKYPRFQSVRL